MLFHLFQRLRGEVGAFNVFRYVSTRTMLATLTSLSITFLVAPWFIRRARARQLGEVIRDDGPAGHASKQGTPTMGGALIIMALVTGTVLWCDLTSPLVWPALFVTVGYGALGFVDDYLKITKKNKRGVPGKLKLLVQFVVGAVAVGWLFYGGGLEPDIRQRLAVPLLNFEHHHIQIPLMLYATFGLVFVVMGCSNGVNLTDGLDGLAIGPVIVSAFTYMLRHLDDHNPVPELDALETRMLDEANQLGIGPMGFGGKTTLLGVKIGTLGRVPASYFVSIAYLCWAARRAGAVVNESGDVTWLS